MEFSVGGKQEGEKEGGMRLHLAIGHLGDSLQVILSARRDLAYQQLFRDTPTQRHDCSIGKQRALTRKHGRRGQQGAQCKACMCQMRGQAGEGRTRHVGHLFLGLKEILRGKVLSKTQSCRATWNDGDLEERFRMLQEPGGNSMPSLMVRNGSPLVLEQHWMVDQASRARKPSTP